MKAKSIFGFLVLALALVLVLPNASAFVDITEVAVNGIEVSTPQPSGSEINIGSFAGDTISVRTTFVAINDDRRTQVTARLIGESGSLEESREFTVIGGVTYSETLHLALPSNLDRLGETLTLEVSVEGEDNDQSIETEIELNLQRVNEEVEILSVDLANEVQAGESLAIDTVLKNRGRNSAQDNFVRASIPALGISRQVFLGDLDAEDLTDADFEDSAAARLLLAIPRNAPAGVYDIEVEAFNDDTSAMVTRRVVIVSGAADSEVISSTMSRTFAVGEEATYTVTIVNADNRIKVYDLQLEAANGLTVDLDESTVAVPAGSSKTVRLTAEASKEGTYDFAVNVNSEGELVKTQNFVANVEGRARAAGGNAAVVLTVILAIIFVVLLVVLIALLTRKPEKQEEFGESYY